jgi:hypothetical protein
MEKASRQKLISLRQPDREEILICQNDLACQIIGNESRGIFFTFDNPVIKVGVFNRVFEIESSHLNGFDVRENDKRIDEKDWNEKNFPKNCIEVVNAVKKHFVEIWKQVE